MPEPNPAPVTWLEKIDRHTFAKKHPEWWKVCKWLISGVVSTAPELIAYYICLWALRALSVTYLPNFFFFNFLRDHVVSGSYGPAVLVYSYMISTAIGYTAAFILNRKATFHADSNVALSTFFYVLMVLFTIFANSLLGPAITGFVERLHMGEGLTLFAGKMLCMFVPGLWTYPCSRFIIHRKKKEAA
ncbi:MAG: GtrA family protein [Oscillospiraceae bacterium]|jgi:putative flippase GtrA|nr:GtrA family protein [Oscillospiraceae bacterium]